jgi:hypothetical protein
VDTNKTHFDGWKLSEWWFSFSSLESSDTSLSPLSKQRLKNNTNELVYRKCFFLILRHLNCMNPATPLSLLSLNKNEKIIQMNLCTESDFFKILRYLNCMNYVIFKDRGPKCILHSISGTPFIFRVFFISVLILLI